MIRVAFATQDVEKVNLHFGAADRLAIYEVRAGAADLVAVADFQQAEMKGENKDKALPAGASSAPLDPDASQPEDKVIAKLEFVEGCAAVYAASIGASSIKRLLALGIQPIMVDNGHDIMDLLNEVSLGIVHGGLSWVDRAVAKAQGFKSKATGAAGLRLVTSVEELDG